MYPKKFQNETIEFKPILKPIIMKLAFILIPSIVCAAILLWGLYNYSKTLTVKLFGLVMIITACGLGMYLDGRNNRSQFDLSSSDTIQMGKSYCDHIKKDTTVDNFTPAFLEHSQIRKPIKK